MAVLDLIKAAGLYALYVVGAAAVLRASYRLFLHPLSSYPGPILGKLTSWYVGIPAFQKRLHLQLLQDHRKYGSVVRVSPNRVVFNTVTAYQGIYRNDQIIKSYTYHSTLKFAKPNVVNERSPDVHRTKRRLIGQALTERALRSFEPALLDQVDIFLSQLLAASKRAEPVNMTDKTSRLAVDIIGQLAFGYDLALQTRTENEFILRALTASFFRFNVYSQVDILTTIEPPGLLDYLGKNARQKYWALLQTMIKARMGQDLKAKSDFYSFVAESLETESTETKSSLWAEANLFITAGGDTVSTLMSATFFYLTRNPSAYRTLVHEIRTTFPSGRAIQGGPLLSSCVFLRACLDESLRLSPPSPSVHWREQNPSDLRPLVIDGRIIPRGTLVAISPYALHHNADYFPDPFAFRPERWLAGDDAPGKGKGKGKADEEAAARQRKMAREAFAAFSTGPRNCAGKSLAYLEAGLVVARTLWYFDFEAAPGKLGEVGGGKPGAGGGRERVDEFQLFDVFSSRHDGPVLVFTPRGTLFEEDVAGVADKAVKE